MKKYILPVLLLFGFYACEETKPDIYPEETSSIEGVDTTYTIPTSELPTAQYRGILIEDLTGVRCVACPNAASAAAAIQENEENNEVVVLGLYTTDPRSLTFPYSDEYPDLRTAFAQDVAENIYNFSNILPGGGVNRTLFDGETSLNSTYTTWQTKANSFKDEKAIVNIEPEIQASASSDSIMDLRATFTFTQDAANVPTVTMILLENDIKHPQKTTDGDGLLEEYKHKHVVRRAYTPFNGTALLTGQEVTAAEQGVVVERGWQLAIPSQVDKNKASVAILVSYNQQDSREVIHCTEIPLP